MREREAKVIVDEAFELPPLDDVIAGASLGHVEERTIHDVYYDTADLRLARWGCTLRHRVGEAWTVKVPKRATGSLLDRHEVVFDGPAGEPPARAVNLVASLTRGAAIGEVARLSNHRLARTWSSGDGAVVAELTDDSVRASTADGDDVSFRELEVELAGDTGEDAITDVVALLTATAVSVGDPVPKLVRVLGPPASSAPDVEVPSIRKHPAAADVIRAALAKSVTNLILQLPAARLGADPGGVHQARVACRRLRSDLKTFEPLLDTAWSARLQAELGWLIDELGGVRDCDVLLETLGELCRRHPEIDPDAAGRVLHRLRLRRRRARRRLLTHLDDERAAELLDHLVAAARAPATAPKADRAARDVMPRLVRKRWRRLDRAVEALGPDPTPEQLHAVRILAKRVRYATEAVAAASPKQARSFARRAAAIQDSLGELNDAIVAGAWLREVAERVDGAAAFTAGQMAQQVLADVRVNDDRWRAAHRAMKKRRAWLS